MVLSIKKNKSFLLKLFFLNNKKKGIKKIIELVILFNGNKKFTSKPKKATNIDPKIAVSYTELLLSLK